MKSFAIVVVGFAAGLAAHILWGVRSPAAAAPPTPSASPVFSQVAAAGPSAQAAGPLANIDWERLRMEVRIAVREELALAAHHTVDAKPVEAAPTAAQKQAASAQAQILRRAIQAGVWRDQEAIQTRALLSQMAPAERFDALNAISKAINLGQLKVEAHAPF